jgi:hypothetical protein
MTTLIIIGIILLAGSYFFYCRTRNRSRFLQNLKDNQVVRYTDEEHIGRIISVYTDSAEIKDMKDGSIHRIMLIDIYPL